MYFNKLFKTGRAFVCGIELFHMVPEFAAVTLESKKKGNTKLTVVHANLVIVEKTAQEKLQNTMIGIQLEHTCPVTHVGLQKLSKQA